uniref:PHD-type domain-containing protein n=1 Tax=Trichuris muris TaxID=70415 RepID=A0A5S6QK14_TRIMR
MSHMNPQVYLDNPSAMVYSAGTPLPAQQAQLSSRMPGPRYLAPGMSPLPPNVAHSTLRGQLGVSSKKSASSSHRQQQKKVRKESDKEIPVAELFPFVPEAQAYADLLVFERKLDSIMKRKRCNIQEALKRPVKVRRKLRIFISHTFFPAKKEEEEDGAPCLSQWELRVEGRLLDEVPGQFPDEPSIDLSRFPKRKFSSFFKSLVIELDKNLYGPDNHLVEWHRTAQTVETDGFQVKRPGDRNVHCTIILLLDYQPMKFKLDARLGRLLGLHTDTRASVIESLWQYITANKLQDPHERDHIRCNSYLEQIFQVKSMRFMEIPQRLNALLHPPDPIVITHTITVDGSEAQRSRMYDVIVEIEDPMKGQMIQFLQSDQNVQELNGYDTRIYDLVEQIKQSKVLRDSFLAFSQDPHGFIQKWCISQCKDLKLMSGMVCQPEAERLTKFYARPWLKEAVQRYMHSVLLKRKAELDAILSGEAMGDSFAKQHCRAVVCHIMQSIGFHNAWSISTDGLACLLADRIYTISKAALFFSHAFGRTEPILDDIGLVFSWMGVSLTEIVDYLNQVEMVPPVHAVPRFPVERPMKLLFRSPRSDDSSRPPYIPEYIPLLTAVELAKQEKTISDEPVEMLKSLQVANEQQSCRISLLSELEKLDAFSAGLVAYVPQPREDASEMLVKPKEQPTDVEMRALSPVSSSRLDEPFVQPSALGQRKKPTVGKVPPSRFPKAEPKRKARRVRPNKPSAPGTSVSANQRREKVEWSHIKDVISEVLEQAAKKHKSEEISCTDDSAHKPCPLQDVYDSVENGTFHVTTPGPSASAAPQKVSNVAKKPKKAMKQEKGKAVAQAKVKPLVISRAGVDLKSGAGGLDAQRVSAVEKETNMPIAPSVEKENEPAGKVAEKHPVDGGVAPASSEKKDAHSPLRITLKLSALQFSKEKKKKKRKKEKEKCKLDSASDKQDGPSTAVAQTAPTAPLIEEKKVPKLILKLPMHGKAKKEKPKRPNENAAKSATTVVEPLTIVTDDQTAASPSPGPSSRQSAGPKALHSPIARVVPSPIPPTPSPGSSSHNSPLHVDMSPVSRGDQIVRSQCPDDAAAPACSLTSTSSPKRPQAYSSDWYCPVCFKGDRDDVDMVCCDSCNCWFHYDCVGLQAAPSTPAWFCQRCAGMQQNLSTQ